MAGPSPAMTTGQGRGFCYERGDPAISIAVHNGMGLLPPAFAGVAMTVVSVGADAQCMCRFSSSGVLA